MEDKEMIPAGENAEEELSVTAEEAGERLDRFLAEHCPYSRSHIQKQIEQGAVRINGKNGKANYRLRAGDTVTIAELAPKELEILPEDIPLDILYEDQDVLIVNKPKGMVVHPAPGHPGGTLVNAVMFHCKEDLSGINGVLRPGIVHRIDKDTTGSLLVCKNDRSHLALADQLKEHSIRRIYIGIVHGVVKDDEGTVNAPIGRDPKERKRMAVTERNSRSAVTHYRVIERFSGYSFLEFQLETGRTHQIRVHMAHIGHPMLGDPVYGPKKCPFKLEGQCLHARTIGFIHPSTNYYMEFDAPMPDYLEKLLEKLRAVS